jgi:hypothetical protein
VRPADIKCIQHEIEAKLNKHGLLSTRRLKKVLREGGRRLGKGQLRTILEVWPRVEYVEIASGQHGWVMTFEKCTF